MRGTCTVRFLLPPVYLRPAVRAALLWLQYIITAAVRLYCKWYTFSEAGSRPINYLNGEATFYYTSILYRNIVHYFTVVDWREGFRPYARGR